MNKNSISSELANADFQRSKVKHVNFLAGLRALFASEETKVLFSLTYESIVPEKSQLCMYSRWSGPFWAWPGLDRSGQLPVWFAHFLTLPVLKVTFLLWLLFPYTFLRLLFFYVMLLCNNKSYWIWILVCFHLNVCNVFDCSYPKSNIFSCLWYSSLMLFSLRQSLPFPHLNFPYPSLLSYNHSLSSISLPKPSFPWCLSLMFPSITSSNAFPLLLITCLASLFLLLPFYSPFF